METPPTLDLRRQWRAMRRGWPLYAVAIAVMLGMAIYYACNKQEQYKIKGTVLIEDEKDSGGGAMRMMGGMAQMMRSFSLAGFSSSVDNEWLVMSSHDVRERAVRALGLTRTYVEHTGLMTRHLLYGDSPVRLEAGNEAFDSLLKSFKVRVHLHDGKADISTITKRFGSDYWSAKAATLPCTVKTPAGDMQLLKTAHYSPAKDIVLTINVVSTNEMATWLHRQVAIDVTSKKGDAITLTIKDDRRRGIDIINAIIAAYNEKRTDRRNDQARCEVEFVDRRLAELQQELVQSEGRMTRFKQAAGVSNPIVESQSWLKLSTQAQSEAAQAQAELTVNEMLLSTLRGVDPNAMLPAIDGARDPSVTQYNELVARRSTLARSANDGNAALEAIDQQLKPLRESITRRAEANRDAARIKLQTLYSQAAQAQGKYVQMPAAEQQYYDLLRDRELKNDLYVFLLEKKENSLLKMASTTTPSFVLDNAYSTIKPDKTKALIVGAIALLLALLGPTVLVLWWQRRRDWVEEPCDLPADLEARTTLLNGDADWTNMLARAATAARGGMLLVADVGGEGLAAEALKRLDEMDIAVTHTTVKTPGEAAALATTEGATIFAEVDDWHHLPAYCSVEQAATHTTAVLLMIAPRAVKRHELNSTMALVDAGLCTVGMTRK